MAELVDALDSGSSRGNSVDVRVILAANSKWRAMAPSSIAIVANGEVLDSDAIRNLLAPFPTIIAVDGGLAHCHRMNLTPQLIVGDLDSAPTDLIQVYSHIPLRRYPRDKNETDLEIALQLAAETKPDNITLFAVTGARLDHTLHNLHAASRYPKEVVIQREDERLFFVPGSRTFACRPGQVISLVPLSYPVEGVTTKGLKWELNHATLDKNFFSQSNVALENEVEVSCRRGDLLVCIENLFEME